jgi:predicted anti-sigma-YlaC factor YlaD
VYSCDQVLAELGNYLDDQVALEIRQELESHLAECRSCKVIYDSTRKTLRIVTESRSFELPESTSTRMITKIMSKVRASRRRQPPKDSGS